MNIYHDNVDDHLDFTEVIDPKTEGVAEPFTSDNEIFLRTSEEEKAWGAIKEFITNDLKLYAEGDSKSFLSIISKRIDTDFRFDTSFITDEFSYLHVEPLLDQAVDLLERGIRERAIFDETSSKSLLFYTELYEYMMLEAIHKDEIDKGRYEVEYKQSSAEFNAEMHAVSWHDAIRTYITDNILNSFWGGPAFNTQFNAVRRAAYLVGNLYYSFKDQVFDKFNLIRVGNDNLTASEHSVKSAEEQFSHQFQVQRNMTEVQRSIYKANGAVSNERISGLKAKMDWDQSNVDFQQRRTLAAKKVQELKMKAAFEPDGALNYGKRIDATKKRFSLDFNQALARLKSIQEGLKKVYGYDVPLPVDEGSIDYFDNCLLWCRQTVQFLIKFSRQEQEYVLPISLRDILKDAAWREGREKGVWEFDIPKEFFANLAHVRLRGVSAFARDRQSPSRLWQLSVRCPLEGQIFHRSGVEFLLDQSKVPTCQLARVTNRNSRREPDTVGMAALFNASPIGKWNVQIVRSNPETKDFSILNDIHLDLHLTFRSIPA